MNLPFEQIWLRTFPEIFKKLQKNKVIKFDSRFLFHLHSASENLSNILQATSPLLYFDMMIEVVNIRFHQHKFYFTLRNR